ncbi:MAG: hypothetical protein HY721_07105 [Planctomycetes bacterium]|nr:hypothetical protein [Planctomycetota bacterium]
MEREQFRSAPSLWAALAFRRLLELPEVRHLPEEIREALAAEAVLSTSSSSSLQARGCLMHLACLIVVGLATFLVVGWSWNFLGILSLALVAASGTLASTLTVLTRRAARRLLQAMLLREGLYRPVCLRCGEGLTGREGLRCPACEARLPRAPPVAGPPPVEPRGVPEARREAWKGTAIALRDAFESAERGARLQALWGRWIVKLRRLPDVSQLQPVDRDRLTVEAAGKASREPLVRTLVKMSGLSTYVVFGVFFAILIFLDTRRLSLSTGPTICFILVCVFLAPIAFRLAASILGFRLARRHLRELLLLEGLRGPPARQL